MNEEIKISLIAATFNRYECLDELITSVINQKYSNFELLIIDQNNPEFLKKMVVKYKNDSRIKWLRSEKGLSRSRNVGLDNAEGDIIAFPDDDCLFLEDTLIEVKRSFLADSEQNGVMGRIIDHDGNDSLKKWKREPFVFNKINMFKHSSSITIFVQHKEWMKFDEELGAGTYYGSCEDIDFIYKCLSNKLNIYYNPKIKLYHPNEDVTTLKVSKIKSYGLGFGAFVKKNPSIINIVLFMAIIYYHVGMLFLHLLRFDFSNVKKRVAYITSRIKGFAQY